MFEGGGVVMDAWPPAQAAWEDLTEIDRIAHFDVCPDACWLCEGNRVFGLCPTCGWDAEADGDKNCLWCGRRVLMEPENAPGTEGPDRW